MLSQAVADAARSEVAADVNRVLDRFELAWQNGTAPALEAFLPVLSAAERRHALEEIIKIDLEYRWRHSERETPGRSRNGSPPSAGLPQCPVLESYVQRFPELGPLARLSLALIGEEYRVRQRWGDRPGHGTYAERFGERGGALNNLLDRIDEEICAELSANAVACGAAGPPHRRLGRYDLGEILGRGAFGTVWRARDVELGREVAVKTPRSGQFTTPVEEERFLREARSAAQLHHAGIVAIHDVGRDRDTLYIVSELVHGESLAERLRRGRLSFNESAELLARVADALDYAHRQGVVHRDLKPANILLQLRDFGSPIGQSDICNLKSAIPKITDFGLALRDAGEVTMTFHGQMLGTPAYMSPEQIGDPHAVDGRSDIYSLGVILYELLTGQLPFQDLTQLRLLEVVTEAPRPPRRLNERVPEDLETICLKCLAKERQRRYRTAGDLAADLRHWLAHEPIVAQPVGLTERSWQWLKRKPASIVAGSLGTVALVMLAGNPAAVFLVAVALGAVLVALAKSNTAAEWGQALEEATRSQQQTAAALQVAIQHCHQARAERDRVSAAAAQVRRRLSQAHKATRTLLLELPDTLGDDAGSASARQLLARTAQAYFDGVAGEIGDDDRLQRELAIAYAKLGDLQSRPADPSAAAQALANYRQSLGLFATLAQAQPDSPQAQRDLNISRNKIEALQRTR